MWNRKQQEKRAPEFDGRMEHPPPRLIPLYANLNAKNSLANTITGIAPVSSNALDKL